MLQPRGLNRTGESRPNHTQQTRGLRRGCYEAGERANEGGPRVIDTRFGRGVGTATATWGLVNSVATRARERGMD